jgi:hypothetical protein
MPSSASAPFKPPALTRSNSVYNIQPPKKKPWSIIAEPTIMEDESENQPTQVMEDTEDTEEDIMELPRKDEVTIEEWEEQVTGSLARILDQQASMSHLLSALTRHLSNSNSTTPGTMEVVRSSSK